MVTPQIPVEVSGYEPESVGEFDLLGATGLGEADALPPPPQGAPYCDKHDALQ